MKDLQQLSRPPRLREIAESVEIRLPVAPTPPRRAPRTAIAKLLLIALLPSLLPPIALGVVTLMLGQPGAVLITSAALMTSLGLAMGITTILTRRDDDARIRTEDGEYRAQRDWFETSLETASRDAARWFQRESRIFERAFPSPADLVARTVRLDPATWERRPDDDDFLTLRLGLGRRVSCVRFSNAEQGASDDMVRAAIDRVSYHEAAPVTWPFRGTRLGICGRDGAIDALLSSLVLQAAAAHAPSELRISVLSRNDDLCAWAKWLPHAAPAPEAGAPALVAGAGSDASRALRAVSRDLASRLVESRAPEYLVIADTRLWDSLPARLADLPASDTRAAVVTIASRYEDLPGACDAVIDLRDSQHGQIRRRGETADVPEFALEGVAPPEALQAALALAPLTDAGERASAAIPSSARLLPLLGDDARSSPGIIATWDRARTAFRLAAPIGLGAGGAPVEIDLRRDGPHALLAGTTGSGKSEFLQSLVVALAARIPPDLLNFVLIDYKGGSAFRDVESLPHVVGMVTDLDDRIAARALISLRAELRRREHLLAATVPACANIIEYQSKPRETPLANLFIIIDEFHRLVTEQPDFIDQMVQIAQQGRSLGVHLLLSTQKPSGVITDHIRANTNLRICLRVTDEADSRDVLGGPEAAHIPRDLPGRVYLRAGNEPMRAAQTGRVSGLVRAPRSAGAALAAEIFVPPVTPQLARAGSLLAWAPRASAAADPIGAPASDSLVDERATLVGTIVAAATEARFPATSSPWRPPLPSTIAFDSLDRTPNERDHAPVIGLVDEPELQRQRPFAVGIDSRHICVAGAGNTGKTSALLTIAAAAAREYDPAALHIYGIDFAGGDLASLEALPHCGGVAPQNDRAAVRWVVQAIKDAISERMTSSRGTGHPRLLILVDNFAAFFASFQNDENGQEASDDLLEMLDLGRSVGITFAIATERPDALRANVLALMQTRFALALAEPEAYAAFGLSRVKPAHDAIPGRALVPGHVLHEVQIAAPPDLQVGSARRSLEGGPAPIAPLPPFVMYQDLLSTEGAADDGMLLGLQDGARPLFRYPDLDHLVVLGPRRTGRSNTLAVAVAEIARSKAAELWVINPRRSQALRSASSGVRVRYAERPPEISALLEDLMREWETRFAAYSAGDDAPEPWAVIIDDIDAIDVPPHVTDMLQQLVLRGADVGARLLVAADTQALRSTYPSGALRALLNMRTGILLGPSTVEDFDLFGARGRPARVPAGRGYLCSGGAKHAIQIAQYHTD